MEPHGERLNKYLALHTGMSRREADERIAHGDVTINNKKAEIGQRVQQGDEISFNGEKVREKTKFSYLLFNKPVGYVCSRKPQGDTPTIYSILPKEYHVLKPVGRLDKDSSGILILTDDGDFSHSMTHPSFHKIKVYEVHIDRQLEPLHQQMISDYGVALDDGPSKFELERLDETRKNWRITMQEGRNRQIRRTFAALGYTVTKLHRTQFGPYDDSHLKSGEYTLTLPH